MVTLTIDGVKVTVERGASILEAAQKAGVRIPTLCNDKRLIPFGACRLCNVEVTARGRTRTMPACFNPARDGMEVATHTPKLIESRRMQLQLLLRSHPLLCPSCDAGGSCELQNLVHEYQIDDLPFSRENRFFHVDNDSHFIRFNMNLCIRCGMCVRVCDEIQGQNELSFINRGMHSEVSTDFGRPLNCEFCGQCASICPVGAISSKWLVGTGRKFELENVNTTCSFCSLGCTLTVRKKDDKIVFVSSPADSPNEGNLCVKGRYGWPYVYSQDRLEKPMIRKDGALKEVGWDEALSFVAENLKRIKSNSGGNSLAALGSERLTNEEAYVLGRFARTVLETPHIDHAAGFGYRPLVDGLGKSLGYPASTNPIRDIRNANVILLLGSDLTETHPIAKNEVILASGRHRAQLIVVDSIRTKLTDRPGLHLPVTPGSEYLIANAMLKSIVDNELFDKAAVDTKAEGLEELIASLADYTPEKVSETSGVSVDLIREAAKAYAEAPAATIILTAGLNRPGHNVEAATAAVNLALITGRIGKPACGVYVFGEKANAQGAIDMGLTPDLLPGFAPVTDDSARAKLEAVWKASIPKEPGFGANEIFSKASLGEIKGLYIAGENPVDTYPDRVLVEEALKKIDFLVVQDMFLSNTARMAHVVLPAASFAEKTGTYTSAERLVQPIYPVVDFIIGKTDLEILTELSALMDKPMDYAGPAEVMAEISKTVTAYGGISYERLASGGLPWPCVDPDDPGKGILYEGGFPGGKAKFIPAAPMREKNLNQLPMYLISGVLKFHSGSFSTWSPSLLEVCPEAQAEMSWNDIRALGINEGDKVKISDASGASVQAVAKLSRRALDGMVIVPSHFPTVKLNMLTRWDGAAVKVKVEKA